MNKVIVWKSRPGGSIAEQESKGLAMCRKLKGFMRIVDGSNITGILFFEVCMQCAVALPNDVMKFSHFYNITRNPDYITDKPFPFLETFC